MKNFYTLLFACAMFCVSNTVLAQYFTDNNGIHYKVISTDLKQVEVTHSTNTSEKYSGEITIPASVTNAAVTYSVVAIGDTAFYTCTALTKVTIPSTVKRIGNYAFNGCNALELPALASLTSLNEIGNAAFYNCSNFSGVLNLSSTVTKIGHNAFYNCAGLINSLILPQSLTWLGNNAFLNCTSFTGAIELPEKLSFIGAAPFINCPGITAATETLTFHDSISYVGFGAFRSFSSLKTINFNADSCYTMIGLDTNQLVFLLCNAVKTINIGPKVKMIPDFAFAGLSTLNYIKCDASKPPKVETMAVHLSSSAFRNIPKDIPVIVPCDAAAAYANAPIWKNFTNIQAVGSTSIPYDLTAASQAGGVKLQWKGDAVNYSIYRDNILLASNISVTSYTDNSVALNSTYCYKIRVDCSNAASNEVCMTYTSVNNVETQHFKVYPIPATDRIFIDGDMEYSQIKIYDVYARQVLTSGNTKEINVSNLPQGTYIISVLNNGISIERIKISIK